MSGLFHRVMTDDEDVFDRIRVQAMMRIPLCCNFALQSRRNNRDVFVARRENKGDWHGLLNGYRYVEYSTRLAFKQSATRRRARRGERNLQGSATLILVEISLPGSRSGILLVLEFQEQFYSGNLDGFAPELKW